MVPSNVREGYFARMLVRRALRSIRSLNLDIRLSEAVGRQIDHFQDIFPELKENRQDILNPVEVEEEERERVICQYDHSLTEADWAMGYRFDIVLRGSKATPFEADHRDYPGGNS